MSAEKTYRFFVSPGNQEVFMQRFANAHQILHHKANEPQWYSGDGHESPHTNSFVFTNIKTTRHLEPITDPDITPVFFDQNDIQIERGQKFAKPPVLMRPFLRILRNPDASFVTAHPYHAMLTSNKVTPETQLQWMADVYLHLCDRVDMM